MSKEILRLLAGPGPLTQAEMFRVAQLNYDIHRRSRQRMIVLYMVMVAAIVVGSAIFDHMTIQVNRDSYNRCQDRAVNMVRVNRFYTGMAALEQSNRFIDAKLRAARVALYRDVQLQPPHCGAKP